MRRNFIRFLIDADLPRQTFQLFCDAGYVAIDVRDIGLGAAPDSEIAAYAREHGYCIVTGDYGFADVRRYKPEEWKGIIVFHIPSSFRVTEINEIVRRLLLCQEILANVAGTLIIVDKAKIRVRR